MYRLLLVVLLTTVWGSAFAQTGLEGKVTDENGNPLVDASVILVSASRGVRTDSTGRFELLDLEPGSYRLRISSIGFANYEQTVQLTEGVWKKLPIIQLRVQAYDFGELIVSATRAGEKTPMAYTNVSKEELEQQNLGQDVPYLLRWTPSAIVTSDAGAGVGYTGIRIRGSDPTRINVTINGIPLNDAESQGVFWVDLPDFITSTNDVQIQRGVGTSTNGAGAFGASINLNTNELRETAYAGMNASAGSFNTFKRNVQFGTGLLKDRFTVDGRLSRITSDGYIDRASADLDAYYLSAAYLGKRSSLRFNAFSGHEVTYQAWNGVDPSLIDDWDTRTFNSAGTEKPGSPYDNEVDDYRQTHYQLLFAHQFSPQWSTHIAWHYTLGSGFFEQYKANQNLQDYGFDEMMIGDSLPDLIRRLWLDNDFYGTVFSLNYRQDRWDVTLGGGYHIYEGRHFGEIIWSELAATLEPTQRYYDNDARKEDLNMYAKVGYSLTDRLNGFLDLQLRQVDYRFLGFDADGANVTQEDRLAFFNPKIGLFYDLGRSASTFLSFAVAHREPNRNDYVESTPLSRPQPERLLDTEWGFRKNWKKASLELNAYYMYYQDQLALNGRLNDVGAYTRINIDQSYRLGLEINGGLLLSPGLDLQLGATFSRNKVMEFTEFVDVFFDDGSYGQAEILHQATDLSFSPNVIASGILTYEPFKGADWFEGQELGLSWMSKYVGEQFIDNTSDAANVIDPYFFTDLRMNYAVKGWLTSKLEFTILVQNVFNAMYETNAWSYRYRLGAETQLLQGFYPQAGRNVLLGLSLTF